MTNEEIFDLINKCLDQHIRGVRGYIREEPYIGDLFKLFAAADENRKSAQESASYITGDGLVNEIGDRSQQTDTPEHHHRKICLLQELGVMWKDWDYAWRMYPLLHQSNDD
jgi:hypothetical protein